MSIEEDLGAGDAENPKQLYFVLIKWRIIYLFILISITDN